MMRLLVPLLFTCACAAPSNRDAPDELPSDVATPQVEADAVAGGTSRRTELPENWSTISPVAFERWVSEALPFGATTRWDDAALAQLTRQLRAQGLASVQAAVALGRSGDPRATEELFALLEERTVYETRNGDAAAVVAAAAAGRTPNAPALRDRLDDLAVGPNAHPDLEVRVECAASAVRLGSDAPLLFLLRVLRIGTEAGRSDPRDFDTPATSAWARGRASDALAARLQLRNTHPIEGSLAARDAHVLDWARQLGPEYEGALK